jgi:WD repeat-containing protein 40A
MLRGSEYQNEQSSTVSYSLPNYLQNRETGKQQPKISCECKTKQDSNPFKVFDWIPFRKRNSLSPYQNHFGKHQMKRDLGHFPVQNCQQQSQATHSNSSDISDFTSRRLPQTVRETEFGFEGMDKVFSSIWLNSHQIVFGTKCQKLVVLDINTKKQTSIPMFQGYDRQDEETYVPHCSGIHSIAMNPSRTLLAVGAGKPNETIQIFKLPTFDLVALLQGHDDMVFSVNWIDDFTLTSGSRDKSLKVWRLGSGSNEILEFPLLHDINVFTPSMSLVEHKEKVRDSVFNLNTRNLFTLSADGTVKIWDANMGKTHSSIPLFHTHETVCLGLDQKDHLVAVGSQAHISLIDSRISKIVHTFESLDEGWGVRSLFSHQNLLSVGGGLGRISFYDLRAEDYLHWNTNEEGVQHSLESGKGWIFKDAIYNRHFHGVKIRNAIYTMAYDQEYSRLFTAGGPLQLNLKGSYVGLWQ